MSAVVNLTKMKEIIKILVEVKDQVSIPMFLWGKHGIGKTSIVRQVADNMNYNCVTLNFANIPIEDATGFPDGKGGYFKPEWLTTHRDNGKHTIYFCDEINRAPKYVLQGLFNFILEGRIHTHTISPKDVVIVAGNPDCDEYETTVFEDGAFLSRFAHFYLEPDIEEYINYLKNNSKVHNSILNSIKLYYNDKINNTVPAERRVRTTPDNRALEKIGKLMNILPREQFLSTGHCITSAMVSIDFATLLMEEFKKTDTIPSINEIVKMKPEDYPFKRDDLDKFVVINTNLIKWFNGVKFNDEKFMFTFSKNKEEDDIIRTGVRNYMNFIPRDYQYAIIKEYKEDHDNVKRVFAIAEVVTGNSDKGEEWLTELLDASKDAINAENKDKPQDN